MRLTWFGGSTFRLYLGGRIIVTDPGHAPAGVDRSELVAAADHVIDLSDGVADFPVVDPISWRPRRRGRLIDEVEETIVQLLVFGKEGLVVDEPEEGPVVIAPGGAADWGPFADGAAVVLFGSATAIAAGVAALTVRTRPKLIALATPSLGDAEFTGLAANAGGCPILVLEAGLAVEA